MSEQEKKTWSDYPGKKNFALGKVKMVWWESGQVKLQLFIVASAVPDSR